MDMSAAELKRAATAQPNSPATSPTELNGSEMVKADFIRARLKV